MLLLVDLAAFHNEVDVEQFTDIDQGRPVDRTRESHLAAYLAVRPESEDTHVFQGQRGALGPRGIQMRMAGLGEAAGVSLTPSPPPEAVGYVLDRLDLILVMTVNPGFGGQSFLRSQLPKIRALRAMIGTRDIRLEVDGGVELDLLNTIGSDINDLGIEGQEEGDDRTRAG